MKLDRRVQDLFGIELPIIQAPMASAVRGDMAAAVSAAGGLGSLPCAMLPVEEIRAEVAGIRQRTSKPFNMNFFCHAPPRVDAARDAAWRQRLEGYYRELGLEAGASPPAAGRGSFDEAMCAIVEELAPPIVSFHFGLPDPALLERVRRTGAKVLSSATTAAEAVWLEAHGCDAVIAQGYEAGGHRGTFLSSDVAAQPGTMALVPQVVDAVKVPVIAAGGIADARGIAAAFALGASAVQLGTAYLFCPEARLAEPHRAALRAATDDATVLTNVFTGRPARGILNRFIREVGPMTPIAPDFPRAAAAVAPLRAAAEAKGSVEMSALLCGQSVHLGRALPAGELTERLAAEALALLSAPDRA